MVFALVRLSGQQRRPPTPDQTCVTCGSAVAATTVRSSRCPFCCRLLGRASARVLVSINIPEILC